MLRRFNIVQHNAWMVGVCPSTISSETVASLVVRPCVRVVVVVITEGVVIDCMRMAGAFRSKDHLNAHYQEDGRHSYETWHSRVSTIPEEWETWVGKRLESGG